MLHNRYSKEELLERLNNEGFKRITLSFYRYLKIEDPLMFRDDCFRKLREINCLGRIYIASEGINAQMSVPIHKLYDFQNWLQNTPGLSDMPLKYAVEDDGKSFHKLMVKVRYKIVADGLDDDSFDTSNVGKHLSALEFHDLIDHPDSIVVDMRNNYESEVGYFENAICPDVVTFKEELQVVTSLLSDKKDKKILLYCTGGVRCEKASAYLKHNGFNDVNQLYGGIIEYAREIKQSNIQSKFIGKNFVFDNRLGERITEHVIAKCHQCGNACDTHTNCAYDPCHKLIIQCSECSNTYNGCCSKDCAENMRA